MAKTYEEIVSNYSRPDPEWQVFIEGTDYSNSVNLIEFEQSISNPTKFTVKLTGVSGRDTNIARGKEAVIQFAGTELFRGVLHQVNAGTGAEATLKGADYSSELDGDISNEYADSNVTGIVNDLIQGTSTVNGRTFQTSFDLDSTLNVADFRVNKTQLKDVNRLMGEYDTEWYVTTDSNNDPVFNVTNTIQNDDNGSALDKLKTSGSGQSAEMVKRNTNRNEGDFDGVKVRGYGDGDDQVEATAGSTGKGNRVLIYTDKTILSSSQAQKRADNLNNSRTVTWKEIKVKPSEPGKLYGLGDLLRVTDENAKIDDDFRVVETYYKINLDQQDISTELTLSNKAQTFISEFETEKEKREGQTDHMQGARNVWGDKEASNATNAEPLEIDFEVPQDVVDIADNNRLDRIEFNYACTPYRQSGNPQSVTASNFDPSTKVVGADVEPAGIEMERSNIKQHAHPVGSSTSDAASVRPQETVLTFSNISIASGGWTKLPTSGAINLDNVEDDKKHHLQLEITNIDTTSDLHIAILGNDETATAAFEFSPDSPEVGESVRFYSQTEVEGGEGDTPVYYWDFGDGEKTLGQNVQHVYDTDGTFSVTHGFFEKGGDVDYNIASTDASNNQVELVASTTGLTTDDLVQIRRSSGNNGEYLVVSNNVGGGPNGGDLLTLDKNISESYSSGDSDNLKGSLTSYTSPTDSVSKNVTVSVASSSLSASSIDGKKKEELSDEELEVLEKSVDENISAQAAQIARGEPDDLDVYYLGSGITITHDGSVETDKDGTLSLSILKAGSNNTIEFGDPAKSDVDDQFFFANAGVFQSYSLDYLFDDVDGVFDGPGEYGYQLTFNSDDGTETDIDTRDDIYYVYRATSTITSPNDGQVFTVQDVTVDFEGVVGEGVNDGDLDLTGGATINRPQDIDGFTLDVYNGTSRTITIDGAEHTFEVSAVDNDDQADIVIDGNTFNNVTEGDVISGVEGNMGVVISKITQDDENGELLGDYESVVFEGYWENSETFNNLSQADYTATFTVDATNTNSSDVAVTDSVDFTVNLTETSFNNAYTVDTESVEDVGGTTPTVSSIEGVDEQDVSAQATSLNNPYTVDTESYNQVGTQQTPANDVYVFLNIPVPQQYISNEYELYIATQGSNTPNVDGNFRIWQLNHTHDMPRQDDFSDVDADIGAGAENKEIPYTRATNDEGDVLLDFSTNNESITLDTTVSGNDVTITVGNIDDDGNITNTEQISANNSTATTANTYQDDELYLRIDSANNKNNFEVRDQSSDDVYTLAAAPEERFRSAKANQTQEDVSAGDGTSQDVVEDVSADLLAGSTANNVRIFIDDDPDGAGNEQEITNALYGMANSGTPKDRELDLSNYVDSPGWYRLKIQPDQASFIKSRIFLDHHKDTQ